ncbi:MAG: glycoside hydrolase family 31 protein [Verrucomicrobia bacterium]|nr:glycoside hydrolase family 31 protein [Verrucomicrobiota bacterium]
MACWLFTSSLAASAAITPVGDITSLTISNDAISGNSVYIFQTSDGGAGEVTPWALDTVRVRWHFTGLWSKEEPMIAKSFSEWAAVASSISNQGSHYLIETPQLDIVVTKSPFSVDFKDKSGFTLLADDRMEFDPDYQMPGGTSVPTGISKLKCIKWMPTNQAYFGLGEYAGPSNRRGLTILCWNNSWYQWGDGSNPIYMNLPFFYGVQPAADGVPAFAYGIFFNNPCRPTFRLGSEWSDRYSFEGGDGQMDYFFFAGGTQHTMKAVADRYSELTGRPTMLPKWGLGYHLGRYSYTSQSWVEYLPGAALTNDIPLDAVYLDIDYMKYGGDMHQLTFNSNFPNPASMVNSCSNSGVKLIPLIEPGLSTADPLYGEAYSNLHFIKQNNGIQFQQSTFFGTASWFDYTSAPFREWWRTKVVNWFNQVPMAGIWNDLSEPEDGQQIPINALLWLDGKYQSTDTRMQWSNERQYFGLREAENSYDILRTRYPNRRPFVVIRSGSCGIQRYGVTWSGDTAANAYYAQACIRLGANVMISGQTYFGHDLGGFSGNVSGDLLTRWHEWGALLPFYRNHSAGDSPWPDGNTGREPWRYQPPNTGANYCGLMRENIKFRYKLMPYLYSLMREATVSGAPMNAPAVFEFFSDSNTFTSNEYDFLCGEWLLAAPIYSENTTSRQIYLPQPATWYYWPTGAKYEGGRSVTVSAPLGTLPLFMRGGAIVPMGPSMRYANQFQPTYLDINCWPEGTSSFTLYEDEGEGWNFTNGVFALTTFTSSRTNDTWDFTIGARQGSYFPGARAFNIYGYNARGAQSVQLNGSHLAFTNDLNAVTQGWTITHDGKLQIKLPDTGAQQALHVVTDWSPAGNYEAISVAGNFTNPQWNPAANFMNLISDHTWQYDITLTNAADVAFKFAANGAWIPHNWGDNDQSQFAPPIMGTGDSFGANIVSSNTLNGRFRLTFNDQTFAYTLTALTDSVGDGIPDWWRAQHFGGDGSTTNSESCFTCDPDGDGMNNGEEFRSGTAPTNAASLLAMEVPESAQAPYGNGVIVQWQSVTGKWYTLDRATNLADPSAFTILKTNIAGQVSTTIVTDQTANGSGPYFYRVGTRP